MEHDPPEHTRLRRILQEGFTPRVVAGFEASFRLLVSGLLEEAVDDERFDFAERITKALPVRLLGRLLGVSDCDADLLVGWTDHLVSNTDPEYVALAGSVRSDDTPCARVDRVELDGELVRLRSNFHNGIKHLPVAVVARS